MDGTMAFGGHQAILGAAEIMGAGERMLMGAQEEYVRQLAAHGMQHPTAALHYPEVAAALARVRGPSPMQQIAERTAKAVVDRPLTTWRRQVQGFGPQSIPALSQANVTVQPQQVFKGDRLHIPSDFAGAIRVLDFKIANRSQFLSGNSCPGRSFVEMFFDMKNIELDTCQPSQQITLSLVNTSLQTIVFEATLFGIAAYPGPG